MSAPPSIWTITPDEKIEILIIVVIVIIWLIADRTDFFKNLAEKWKGD